MKLSDRIKRGWSLFRNHEEIDRRDPDPFYGPSSSHRPDRSPYRIVSQRSIMKSIINRIAVDFSEVNIKHVRLDKQGRYSQDEKGPLNDCLLVEPNIDQGPTEFRRDIATTMLEGGIVAITPTIYDIDPEDTDAYKIEEMRAGTVVSWYPRKVRIRLFNDEIGRHEEITVPKRLVALVENPFYDTMNEPNGTLQRLARKMTLMDTVDEQIGSNKLDMIIQLPYTLKTDSKKAQAEKRRGELIEQLQSNEFGFAYTDATERVIQLNRPVENNLVKTVEYLTNLLYDQLGITEAILNGTAKDTEMLNYQNRIIKPMLTATVESMRRKFLSKTARSQNQSIDYFQNPFALVPIEKIADLGDKLTRNAILSSNEFRQILGYQPVDDEMAEKLINKNMPVPLTEEDPDKTPAVAAEVAEE